MQGGNNKRKENMLEDLFGFMYSYINKSTGVKLEVQLPFEVINTGNNSDETHNQHVTVWARVPP